MKKALFKTGVLVCSLFFISGAGLSADVGLLNQDLFPPEFFPNLSEVPEEELLLAGLRSLYPKRILTELPETREPQSTEPVVRELDANGLYIRVRHLPEALSLIRENLSRPLLVLDFRFLSTDLESTLALGALLTRQNAFKLALAGNYPVPQQQRNGSTVVLQSQGLRSPNQTIFTLSNHETRGPIEALLAQLTIDGEIISVGGPSSGQTAAFRPFPGLESYFLISGEIRPANGESLLEEGFVPQVEVKVTPDEDMLGYGSLREGVSLDDLVHARVAKPRFDEARLLRERNGGGPLDEDEDLGEEEPALPQDTILQRALNIVKALQALGKIGG